MKEIEQAKRLLYALTNVNDKFVAEAVDYRQKARYWKRGWVRPLAVAAACMAIVFAGYIAGNRDGSLQPDEQEGVLVGNPIQEVGSLAEAEKLTGFGMEVPKSGKLYSRMDVVVFDGSVIEVSYLTEDGSNLGYYIRKALGTEDVSGDYNEYSEVDTRTVNGYEVTLKGDNGLCSLAVWTDGTYYYAVGAQNNPMTPDDILKLASGTR